MRWIDFEQRTPVEPVNNWPGWSQEDWDAWQEESDVLLGEVACLNQEAEDLRTAGMTEEADAKLKERNEFIDKHKSHWGKLKPWLFALSAGKCWFTEGRDICSHQDVEHFRPKKEAVELDAKVREFNPRNAEAEGALLRN